MQYIEPYPFIIIDNQFFDYNVKPSTIVDYEKFKYYPTDRCINLEECQTIKDAIQWVENNDFWSKFPDKFYYDIVKDIYVKNGKISGETNNKKLNERYRKQTEECLRKVDEDFEKLVKRYNKKELLKKVQSK
jgi:hypothetical protein